MNKDKIKKDYDLSEGASYIALERYRQINNEGYSTDNDDKYTEGELLRAAVAYICSAGDDKSINLFSCSVNKDGDQIDVWPWEDKYDKRLKHNTLRKLEIAGALIAAEIDRMRRLKKNEDSSST